MMDHNPGPIPIILKFTIDAVCYLASDEDNIIAVHCKAGKGRTGLAICAYFILTELCFPNSNSGSKKFFISIYLNVMYIVEYINFKKK